jgi:hypothetical protein
MAAAAGGCWLLLHGWIASGGRSGGSRARPLPLARGAVVRAAVGGGRQAAGGCLLAPPAWRAVLPLPAMGLKDIVVQKLQAYFGDYVDGLSAANLEMQARRHPRPMAGCRRPRRPRPRPRSSLPRPSANHSRCGAFLPQVLAGTIKQSELSLKAGKEASQPASQPAQLLPHRPLPRPTPRCALTPPPTSSHQGRWMRWSCRLRCGRGASAPSWWTCPGRA